MDAAMRQSRMPMSIVGWHSAAECACLPLTPWDGDIVEAGVRAYLQPMIMEFIKRGTVPAKAPTHFDKIQTGFIDEVRYRSVGVLTFSALIEIYLNNSANPHFLSLPVNTL